MVRDAASNTHMLHTSLQNSQHVPLASPRAAKPEAPAYPYTLDAAGVDEDRWETEDLARRMRKATAERKAAKAAASRARAADRVPPSRSSKSTKQRPASAPASKRRPLAQRSSEPT